MILQSTAVLIIIVGLIVLYVTEIIPMSISTIFTCFAMALCGIVPFSGIFAGFGSDMCMLVAGMMVVNATLFKTGAAVLLGRGINKFVGNSEKLFIAVIILLSAAVSAFLSNVATTALFLPIIDSVSKYSQGRILKKNTYMLLGISVVTGGILTMVGSPSQLLAQEVLLRTGCRPIDFFELGTLGLPRVALILLYYLTLGYWLQKKVFTFNESVSYDMDKYEEVISIDNKKIITSMTIMLFCIIGFVTQIWTGGTVALLGACLCILTRCISEKEAYRAISWSTIVILACDLCIASGIQTSGVGDIIAKAVIRILGDSPSNITITAVLVGFSAVMSNIMSQTATVAVLTPVGVSIALELNMDPTIAAMGIVGASTLSCCTPTATIPMVMTLPAGYRFTDYIKVGGPLAIMGYLLTVIVICWKI